MLATMAQGIRLRPISAEAAAALAAGRPPDDVVVAGSLLVGEEDDEHDGVPMRVRRFELEL
jgi:hypothetical protein